MEKSATNSIQAQRLGVVLVILRNTQEHLVDGSANRPLVAHYFESQKFKDGGENDV
jgi:hypothetical protein